ncbi:LysR family transcriptional regulator [Streptomyces sp. NPDC051738]|uniref:LysR family transcriptional regulator n=1 Tax=Streptomyces sp. NPDC051738 TaxID=3365672 RepID=UPI0037D08F70
MDLHVLKTFVAVAQRRSFSDAARALGYTQSAVSQQVAALENDLGVQLLNRRPVSLTAEGHRLLEHAQPLLHRLEAARSDVTRQLTAPAGALVLGVSPLAMTREAVSALALARAASPRTAITLRMATREAIAAEVSTGTFDLGLIDGIGAPDDPLPLVDVGPLKAIRVAEEPVAVLLPADHPLKGRPRLHLADLCDAQWIDAPSTSAALTELRAICHSKAFPVSLRYEGLDVRTLQGLAEAGLGQVVLPWSVARESTVGTAVPLATPRIVHRREVLYRRKLDGAAKALVMQLMTPGRGS